MRIRLFWLAFCLLGLWPVGLSAQMWPALDEVPAVEASGTEDVAILVGIEDYVFMPDVAGARQNVADWEVFLRDGLGVDTVFTLINEQGVREELMDAASRATQAAGEGSTVWFVFVGHGAPSKDGKDGYLVGADAQQNPKSIEARGLRRSELLDVLEAGPQKRTVVLFDACFSGQTAEGEMLAEGIQPVVPVEPAPTNAPGTVVLSAAQSDEFAGRLPGAERPAFSYLVLGGMRGWAAGSDGTVTAQEAVDYARRELLALPGRRQTPQVHGLSNAILTSGVGEAAPSKSGGVASTDDVSAPSVADDEPTVVHWKNGRPVDPTQPDQGRWLAVSVAAGYGVNVSVFDGTPLVDGIVGINLGRGAALRMAVGLSYFHRPNPWAGEYEKAVNALAADGIQLPDPENGLRTHLLGMAVGPGWAHRPVGSGVGVSLDSQLGVAVAPAGQCNEWGEDFRCSGTEGVVNPLFGLRIAAKYAWFEVAIVSRLLLAQDVNITSDGTVQESGYVDGYTGLTLGMTFDI